MGRNKNNSSTKTMVKTVEKKKESNKQNKKSKESCPLLEKTGTCLTRSKRKLVDLDQGNNGREQQPLPKLSKKGLNNLDKSRNSTGKVIIPQPEPSNNSVIECVNNIVDVDAARLIQIERNQSNKSGDTNLGIVFPGESS